MVEEAEIQKLKNKYPELSEQFSPELLELVFSEKTSLEISRICLENEIKDEETVEKIAYRVTLVLLDRIPKENLATTFEKGVGLNRETAEKISAAVEERIFPFPKISGSQLLKQLIKKPSSAKPEVTLPPEPPPEEGAKKTGKDNYREKIE